MNLAKGRGGERVQGASKKQSLLCLITTGISWELDEGEKRGGGDAATKQSSLCLISSGISWEIG
jgi:hypothetical protein